MYISKEGGGGGGEFPFSSSKQQGTLRHQVPHFSFFSFSVAAAAALSLSLSLSVRLRRAVGATGNL